MGGRERGREGARKWEGGGNVKEVKREREDAGRREMRRERMREGGMEGRKECTH